MASFFHRLKNYFIEPLFPPAAFLISRHYLGGIHFSPKEKKLRHHFLTLLKPGILEPSFEKKNIINAAYLENKIREGVHKLQFSGSAVSLLIPESCLKIFVFSFHSLPSGPKEREEFIRWRLNKVIPLKGADVRISYDVLRANNEVKVFLALAKASVIQEYEKFFGQLGLKVRSVGLPALYLLNLVSPKEEKNVMVVNLEEDFVSLAIVLDSEISYYRFKPFSGEISQTSASEKMAQVVNEIENTAHFIEDREKKKISSLWLRFAFLEDEESLFSLWKERISMPFHLIQPSWPLNLNSKEKQLLTPLIGQIS